MFVRILNTSLFHCFILQESLAFSEKTSTIHSFYINNTWTSVNKSISNTGDSFLSEKNPAKIRSIIRFFHRCLKEIKVLFLLFSPKFSGVCFNSLQDGPFQGCSRMGGGQKRSLPKICHIYPAHMKLWNLAQLYLT